MKSKIPTLLPFGQAASIVPTPNPARPHARPTPPRATALPVRHRIGRHT
ncbi:hypothetical protein [Crenobacter caeni]|uniref:Uncharacterized protein n=1 Tax=Crenobacter caeni TaxID=2705474 RepID=A0A6B2KUP5_9NEIS|nr:hypothetical protein [Crenobacter caeni]NDV13729.1 hypothetical protein [Crenobacter caeni]